MAVHLFKQLHIKVIKQPVCSQFCQILQHKRNKHKFTFIIKTFFPSKEPSQCLKSDLHSYKRWKANEMQVNYELMAHYMMVILLF